MKPQLDDMRLFNGDFDSLSIISFSKMMLFLINIVVSVVFTYKQDLYADKYAIGFFFAVSIILSFFILAEGAFNYYKKKLSIPQLIGIVLAIVAHIVFLTYCRRNVNSNLIFSPLVAYMLTDLLNTLILDNCVFYSLGINLLLVLALGIAYYLQVEKQWSIIGTIFTGGMIANYALAFFKSEKKDQSRVMTALSAASSLLALGVFVYMISLNTRAFSMIPFNLVIANEGNGLVGDVVDVGPAE